MAAEDSGATAEQSQSRPFAAMDAVYDPESYRLLYARGIDDGWRCLEVGAGSGSITRWLCSRVGKNGRVVATDLDITQLAELDEPNLEVHRHDIVTDPVPERVFNLVHARLAIGQVQERRTALEKMASSLMSGGWLMVEDLDRTSLAADTDDAPAAALFARVQDAVAELLRRRGLDPAFGRRLFRDFRSIGLADVVARGASAAQTGGSPGAELLRQEVEQFREDLTAAGLVTPSEIDGCLALLADPEFVFLSATMVTAWGRRLSRPAW